MYPQAQALHHETSSLRSNTDLSGLPGCSAHFTGSFDKDNKWDLESNPKSNPKPKHNLTIKQNLALTLNLP